MTDYPWYSTAQSADTLQQGDIIERCPIATSIISPANEITRESDIDVKVKINNVIVLSQSSDLKNAKIDAVVICPCVPLTVFQEANLDFKNEDKLKELSRGYVVGYHLLNKSDIISYEREAMVVNFRDVRSVDFDWIVGFTRQAGKRLRLLPPYRERLSQAFARFFMRVGSPIDIVFDELPHKPKKKGKQA